MDYNARAANAAEQQTLIYFYQARVMFWQTLATIGAFLAAGSAAFFAWLAIGENRRVGEAQTRAYLSIKSAKLFLVDKENTGNTEPTIDFVVENSGQSPATNFLFNIYLTYVSNNEGAKTKEGELRPDWRNKPVSLIPPGCQSKMGWHVPNMSVSKFLNETGPPSDALYIIARIVFQFDDVFGKTIPGETYFTGLNAKFPDGRSEITKYGGTEWRTRLRRGLNPRKGTQN